MVFESSNQIQNTNLQNNAASLHIDYPMLFELRNAATERVSHCGVLEFIAEEGMIYMPYWVGGFLWFSMYIVCCYVGKEVLTVKKD